MNAVQSPRTISLTSFTAKCLIKGQEAYLLEPAPLMCAFFGTTEINYKDGIIKRIRKDISPLSASLLEKLLAEKTVRGDDFRIAYPSKRANGSPCTIQLDAYARERTGQGYIYDLIGMDITNLVEARQTAQRLTAENLALTEDSPVGLGIYHIRDNKFNLVYTNAEYYKVHGGSKAYWDKFKDRDALERILPEDRQVIYDEWHKTLGNPSGHIYQANYRCLGEDGQIHWIRLLARLSNIIVKGEYICYASYLNIDKEKQAETRAEQMRLQLLDTLNQLPSISVLYKVLPQGVIQPESYSQAFVQMLGGNLSEVQELFKEGAFAPVHPDDRARLKQEVSDHLTDTSSHTATYRILTSNQCYKWVRVNYTCFQVEEETYIYVLYTDIDELKKQEALLKDQYAAAQGFLDSIASTCLATLRINLTQNTVEQFSSKLPLLSDPTSRNYDLLLSNLQLWMPRIGDRREGLEKFSRQALIASYQAGQHTVCMEFLFHPRKGSIIWVKAMSNLIKQPGSQDIVAFSSIRNINQVKTINIILNNILSQQYDFIASIDTRHNSVELISSNQHSAQTEDIHSGRDYDKIMHCYVERHVVPEEKEAFLNFMTLKNVLHALEQTQLYTSSFTMLENKVLRKKRLDFSYIDKESQLVALIRTDFTELQQERLAREEELRAALNAAQQASVAKSEFLSRMSHEIRTPMNAIIGLDTIALQESHLSPVLEDYLKKIGISARFLLSLINDILDMSRIESGKMLLKNDLFNFHKMIATISAILSAQCQERGLAYECVVKGFVEEEYRGDETKLQQVLLNILGNAVKFTPAGGKIHFLIEQLEQDQKTALVRFTIADTGSGIDAKFLPHIFEAFSQENTSNTTAYGGTGLGLAISKNIVKLMDGKISVHSVKGKGTDFTVEVRLSLPPNSLMWQQLQSAPPHQPLQKTYHFHGEKLLLAEDNFINAEIAKRLLEMVGLQIVTVTNGVQVIKAFTEAKPREFAAILMDIRMPLMDGLEACRIIRSLSKSDAKSIPIIAMSANAFEEDIQKSQASGMNAYLTKPVEPTILYNVLQEQLEKK